MKYQSVACSTPAHLLRDHAAVLLTKSHDLLSTFGRFVCDLRDPVQEKLQPMFPSSFITDRLQSVDVFVPVLLEVKGGVEERFIEDPLLDEPESDQESSRTS